MGTVIDFQHRDNFDRHLRWERYRRADLFEPGGPLRQLSPEDQDQLYQKAKTLADVFQHSSSNVEGRRNGYLSLRNHQFRRRYFRYDTAHLGSVFWEKAAFFGARVYGRTEQRVE